MKALNNIALILLIIGGLNWLLVGIFEFDLVAAIFGAEFGETTTLSRIVYVIVGLCALYALKFLSDINRDKRHTHHDHHDTTHRDTTTTADRM